MGELEQRVGEAGSRLWKPGESVAVAVSGGADSVALLHLLSRSRDRHGAVLSVITVDHGLRPTSAEDAAWVVGLADSLELPSVLARVSCGPAEHAARAARYAAFAESSTDWVALAHHRDDQLETLLINLVRGTGLRGVCGMRAKRGQFVRPMLDVPSADLRSWLLERDLGWREDATNAEPRYLRNRLRQEVLPRLAEVRDGSLAAMARSMRLLAEVDDDLERRAASMGMPPWDNLSQCSPAVLRRALLRCVPGTQHAHIDEVSACIARGGGAVTFPGGLVVRIRGDRLMIDA